MIRQIRLKFKKVLMFSKKFLHHLSSYALFGPLVFFFELFLRQVFKLLRKGCGDLD